MALITPTQAKTNSDAADIQVNPFIGSLTETLISTFITDESNRTDTKTRIYTVQFYLEADVNGRTSPVDIIQSDASKIKLTDAVLGLEAAGFRVTHKSRKTHDGINDKVVMTVGWN